MMTQQASKNEIFRLRFAPLKMTVKRNARLLLDLIFPIECLGCGQEGVWFCPNCLSNLPLLPARHCPFCGQKNHWGQTCQACCQSRALAGAIAFIPYANPVIQKLIQAWKYQGAKNLTQPLSIFVSQGLDAMTLKLREQSRALESGLSQIRLATWPALPTLILSSQTTLVPVPLAPKRLRSRGFNQAEELALALQAKRGYNLDGLIKRTRHSAAQATLSGSDRLTNVKQVFALTTDAASIVNKNFLIIDDVITTGSTCEAIARLLKGSGAASVWALAIAFGHPL